MGTRVKCQVLLAAEWAAGENTHNIRVGRRREAALAGVFRQDLASDRVVVAVVCREKTMVSAPSLVATKRGAEEEN